MHSSLAGCVGMYWIVSIPAAAAISVNTGQGPPPSQGCSGANALGGVGAGGSQLPQTSGSNSTLGSPVSDSLSSVSLGVSLLVVSSVSSLSKLPGPRHAPAAMVNMVNMTGKLGATSQRPCRANATPG